MVIALVLIVCLLLSGCESRSTETSKSGVNEESPRTGSLAKKGERIRLNLIRQVRLDTDSAGFMVRFHNLVYRDKRFYAVGTAHPEVYVYAESGNFLKTIAITPQPKSGCSFLNIARGMNGKLWIKDIGSSEILEIDSAGQVVSRVSTRDMSEKISISPAGLEIVDTPSGALIFSTVYEEAIELSDFLAKTSIIGCFDRSSKLVRMFANHHPAIAEFGLFTLQASTFAIYDKEIYLVEEALPYIRVYSFDGLLKRSFGAKSPRHRPLEKETPQASVKQAVQFINSHTRYVRTKVVTVRGYERPLLIVYYTHALLSEENLSREYYDVEREHYLAIYSLDGELLENDVQIPGELLDVDEKSNVVLLLSNRPDNRVIGLYSMTLRTRGQE